MSVSERAAIMALEWIGTPYVHQASLKGAGSDCLGLVRGIRRELGHRDLPVPAYAPGWGEIGEAAEPLLEAAAKHLVREANGAPRPGQVVVFRIKERGPAKHCGIVVHEGHFVHAYTGVGTVSSALSEPWRRRIVGLFSFPSAEARELPR